MEEDIVSLLATYIATDILRKPARRPSPDEPLISSGILDSFSLIDLALFVEETFGVHLDTDELNRSVFDTLRELANLIKVKST